MGFRRWRPIVLSAALLIFFWPGDAWGWGPGTHVRLASDVLANLSVLPAAVAAIIAAHRRYFSYGNVATDTVFAKKMSKVKQVCHRWETGFGLLDRAESDAGRAFAYGYLAHLAADTVAHNKFLPRQMAVSGSTVAFGHFYWEIRADARVQTSHWHMLRRLVQGEYVEPERLLRLHLQRTMLSYGTNRVLFRRINMLASEDAWLKSVRFWERLSRYRLDEVVMGGYHAESLGRILDVLSHGRRSAVLHEDPNGNAALSYARAQRRQLRQLRRAHIGDTHIIREAAAGHAPVANRALVLNPLDRVS